MTVLLNLALTLALLTSLCVSQDTRNPQCDGHCNADTSSLIQIPRHKIAKALVEDDRTPSLPVPRPPSFQLVDRSGNILENSKYEFDEQSQLAPLLRNGDRVLQLGGNIGTSCIAAAKSNKRLAANLCVEPNKLNLAVLKQNLERNNVNVSVLEGIVADSCPDMYIHHSLDIANNEWANRPVQDHQNKGQPVTCTGLKSLQETFGNFNVILADCEGCFPAFLQDNFALLQDLQVVVLELDWIDKDGDYGATFVSLEKLGLRCPNVYTDSKYGGLARATCWRTESVQPAWAIAPSFADGPKWGADYEHALKAAG